MNDQKIKPLIGITMGDPLGIGPEILVKTLTDPEIQNICRPLVIGDPNVMDKAAQMLKAPIKTVRLIDAQQGCFEQGKMNLLPVSELDPTVTRLTAPTPLTGSAMENYILTGIDLALQKKIDALVTCPITKTGLKEAGSKFHGHTEMLADRTGTKEFAMMMAGEQLKVVLVTIHIPLSDVPGALTKESIYRTIRLTASALKERFGISHPRLAAAGLNPHAGEKALFGDEEARIIEPAVQKAREDGMDIVGPLPPDTVFFHAANNQFDAVVCMYHDQGLIPFKLIHFEDGVNTTLGLPIIRTSVDHGTAYDIAWQGKANPSSLKQAIRMAVLQAGNQRNA